jgi:DNA-binding NtrC family response regulator
LIDSELFGHARGAFTGALEARPGVFEQADGGTLLLDEIGDMPLHVQARLLRVLQEREVRPIGGDKPRPVDVRVLAATHVDMQRAVRERRFREDLFYRFNVVTLAMPPLRDRTEDIPALVAHFVRKHGARAAPELTPAALDAMMGYDWPGNVRELENAVLQIIALHGGDRVDVAELPARVREAAARPGARGGDDELTIAEARNRVVARFERDYLERLMTRAGGNISEASRQAGLDRANLRRLLRRHRIDPLRYRGERQPSQGS